MGTVLTNRKEEIKIQKRKVDTLADFKSIWQLQKLLMLSGWALIKST
jgi:preprotein translocase subunit Sec63